MRMSAMLALQGALLMGGALTLALAGVRLKIDKALEEFFIEVDPSNFDRAALRAVEKLASDLGYEVMPEWECEPEVLDNGVIRHWMAEKEMVHDSRSSLQAV